MASSQLNGAAPPGPTTPRWWPEGYNGEPIDRGRRILSTAKFPCFGESCANHGKWHGANTLCVPFCDWKMWKVDKVKCWQRMCDSCAAAKGCHAPAEDGIAADGDKDEYPNADFGKEGWDQELEDACKQAELASVAARPNQTNLSTPERKRPTSPSPLDPG